MSKSNSRFLRNKVAFGNRPQIAKIGAPIRQFAQINPIRNYGKWGEKNIGTNGENGGRRNGPEDASRTGGTRRNSRNSNF